MSRRALVRPASDWVNTTTQTVRKYSGNPSLESAYFDPLVSGTGSIRYSDLRNAKNFLTRSEALDNAAWSKARCSITADQATGPDGATALDEIVEDGTASTTHLVQQNVTLTADATYAMSWWAAANTRDWCRLQFRDPGDVSNFIRAWFNLSNGIVGTTAAGGTAAIDKTYTEDWTGVSPGLYRIVLVGSIGNSATTIEAQLYLATQDAEETYNGDGSSSIYAGYAQVEDDVNQAGLYVQTTSAAVT